MLCHSVSVAIRGQVVGASSAVCVLGIASLGTRCGPLYHLMSLPKSILFWGIFLIFLPAVKIDRLHPTFIELNSHIVVQAFRAFSSFTSQMCSVDSTPIISIPSNRCAMSRPVTWTPLKAHLSSCCEHGGTAVSSRLIL